MPKVKSKPLSRMTLDEVREEVKKTREQGLQIISNFHRLEKEYSDWEDRFYAVEKAMLELEEQYNTTKEEIYAESTPFGDIITE